MVKDKITFILGGARSGKSQFAVELAKKKAKKVAFIATSKPGDLEMKRRVALHKKNRPRHWQIFEEPKDILLKRIGDKFEVIIIDCLTLLVSELMLGGLKEDIIEGNIHKMLSSLKKIKAKSIIVSNEIGLGIVPDNPLARRFRDLMGRVNQMTSKVADEVYLMVAGLSVLLKGAKHEENTRNYSKN